MLAQGSSACTRPRATMLNCLNWSWSARANYLCHHPFYTLKSNRPCTLKKQIWLHFLSRLYILISVMQFNLVDIVPTRWTTHNHFTSGHDHDVLVWKFKYKWYNVHIKKMKKEESSSQLASPLGSGLHHRGLLSTFIGSNNYINHSHSVNDHGDTLSRRKKGIYRQLYCSLVLVYLVASLIVVFQKRTCGAP